MMDAKGTSRTSSRPINVECSTYRFHPGRLLDWEAHHDEQAQGPGNALLWISTELMGLHIDSIRVAAVL